MGVWPEREGSLEICRNAFDIADEALAVYEVHARCKPHTKEAGIRISELIPLKDGKMKSR